MVNIGKWLKWLKWIVFLGILIQILIGVISSYYMSDCSNSQRDFIEMSIFDKVTDKYIDTKNHNFKTIVMEKGNIVRLNSLLGISIFDQIEIGDSVSKEMNSRFLTLYKTSGEEMTFKETELDCEYLLK